ncbi:unnamed protein product [Spirodela intermedia]|uniref:Probable Ufm1-specific protease n=1 Tax=Spirodela intermedia TaxID=51605 RepID=A0A7I8IRN2_SPIIN|nr:unnamed protein product [Spirodela intermedia]CAA6659621.1 unnamed protein product [Spirodela intermedia]
MDGDEGAPQKCVRLLCRRRIDVAASSGEPALYWLVGSSLFLPPFTVASIVKCLYWEPSIGPESVHYSREADEIRTFLPRGLDVIGALFVGNQEKEENAKKAIEATIRVRELLFTDKEICDMVGASSDMITKDVSFFIFVEKGCLLRCDLTLKLPIYVAIDKSSEAVEMFSSIVDAAAAKLRDPKTLYLLELKRMPPEETVLPVVLHGTELGLDTCVLSHKLPQYGATESDKNIEACSYFFSKSKRTSFSSIENADTIQVSLFSNQSENALVSGAPLAGYFPAPVSAKYSVVDFKLDVLCYSSRDFPLVSAVSKLIIPGLVDQLFKLKEIISPKLSTKHPQVIRTLHLRLGLPVDRPLLLIANSLNFTCTTSGRDSIRNGCTLLKDVHTNIPSSGVSGGLMSLIQGSYEYYHYLQNGFDDNGWGCAYRSLQTIISWFRLQYYTSIEVPSHREIQQALVEIGDKEPSFVGSREWIGAIELSFVLDKLLGVSCKIMNVRSGVELPEKCRELALHFETQGTPVMIGGGVLAYTLLGVDYNDVTGDCAFLILDPHYTGTDEIKRVVSGGWCGWKKAVDSRGKNFFLSDKFYNLLLPQRPNMV